MRSPFAAEGSLLWTGFLALVVTIFAGGVWSALLVTNLATTPKIPWSAVVMGVALWLLWQYLGGRWRPHRTSVARRTLLRAKGVSLELFAWALIAGMASVVALTGFWIVLIQSVRMPARVLPNFAQYPLVTVAAALVMASLVAAVAEEAGFRGYFQSTLERRFGGPTAILIGALVILPAHALTQGFVWPTIVFYLLVDAVFGLMAYLTGSIVPGIVVHAIGLLIFFTIVWPRDAQRPLAHVNGADIWFWVHATQAIAFAVLAAVAFQRIAMRKSIIAEEQSRRSSATPA